MIVFRNQGEIDIRSIASFGVSVKEGENPIGFFGTGLKYAIAVLLRTGHKVSVFSGRRRIEFTTSREEVRGVAFDFVTMAVDGAPPAGIGFTTQLGKQWQVWMAYREIACNCTDERGTIESAREMPQPQDGSTVFVVQGEEFERTFADRSLYILEDAAAQVVDRMEIRNRPGSQFFYRGVRVADLPRMGLFTYNTLESLDLTEDRTAKSPWDVVARVVRAVLSSADPDFIRRCVTGDKASFEGALDYHGWGRKAGPTFLSVVGECMREGIMNVNVTAAKVWREESAHAWSPAEVALTRVQQASLERALDFCTRIGFPIRGSYPIKVVESLGTGGLGLARDRTIYVAERAFHLGGAKQVASTLIEEYLHLRHEWKDCTRELQSFLFDKVVSMGEELQGAPL